MRVINGSVTCQRKGVTSELICNKAEDSRDIRQQRFFRTTDGKGLTGRNTAKVIQDIRRQRTNGPSSSRGQAGHIPGLQQAQPCGLQDGGVSKGPLAC